MNGRALAGMLLAAGMALAVGCSARRSVPVIGDREITDPELLLGQRVFNASCHQCHPNGSTGLGFALNNKPLPEFLIRFQVRHGLGAMPAFSEEEISDEALDALAEYVVWLRDLPPVEAGDQPPGR